MEDEDRTVILTQEEVSPARPAAVQQERLTKLLDMAFWHKQVGNTKSAILACEAAIVLDKDNITAHSLLGSLYEKQGDTQRAIEHMERVVALSPKNPMEEARLEQLRHDALQKAATGGGLINMMAARSGQPKPVRPDRDNSETSKLLPALIAAAVVAGVLTFGLYALHKPPQVASADTTGGLQVRPGPGPGFGLAVPGATTPRMSMGSSPNIVAMPKSEAPTGTIPTDNATKVSGAADPFAFGAPPLAPTTPDKSTGGDSASDKVKILPPISVPQTNGEVPPAPVTVPNTDGTAVTPLPQHTVVIQDLPGQQASPPASYQSPAAAPYDPSVPVPHIQITVDKDDGSSPNPTADRNNAIVIGNNQQAAADTADGLQTEALDLQQQGDFARAAQAYTKAIHLYTSQIASGNDVDTARRALQSCQTGLKICQASQ